MNRYAQIYTMVGQIPYGQVATYGQIADLANLYGRARLVGYALYQIADPDSPIPWHRVVNAKGEISYDPVRHGNDYLQRQKLEAEGIVFDSTGKINLRVYRWHPSIE